ncbi:MAG: hypothetical protein RL757_830 [Bacteroidota bacterium]|jgi:Fe2+ transport system protein FeoA
MNLNKTLSELKEGEAAILSGFSDEYFAGKLLSMGVLPGSRVLLIRRLPNKGGIYVRVEAANFAFRDEEAKLILIA